ncbi:MAG: immunoglobulin domain-containing protein, partial [Candidatus Kapaibacteriota bacterium]
VEFSVQASFTGGTSLDYQWRKDGIALVDKGRISGSQSPTLTITNINIGDAGNYDVVLTNNPSGYSTTSAPAQLNVEVQPTIIQQPPSSINLNSGEKLTIEIIADGTEPLTYQWYKDGVQIVDANQSTYEKSSVTNEDAGTYYCKVQNDCGEVVSNNCIVSVTLKQVAGLQSSINDIILEQNNPNPVNSHTIISFSVPNEGNASVEIFDVVGRKVATLFNGPVASGTYNISFNLEEFDLPSGTYIYKLHFNGTELTRQMLVIR